MLNRVGETLAAAPQCLRGMDSPCVLKQVSHESLAAFANRYVRGAASLKKCDVRLDLERLEREAFFSCRREGAAVTAGLDGSERCRLRTQESDATSFQASQGASNDDESSQEGSEEISEDERSDETSAEGGEESSRATSEADSEDSNSCASSTEGECDAKHGKIREQGEPDVATFERHTQPASLKNGDSESSEPGAVSSSHVCDVTESPQSRGNPDLLEFESPMDSAEKDSSVSRVTDKLSLLSMAPAESVRGKSRALIGGPETFGHVGAPSGQRLPASASESDGSERPLIQEL